MGNLGRQRMILYVRLCLLLLPLLINVTKLLKLTQAQDEDHLDIDVDHPSSPFFSDHAANDRKGGQFMTLNASSLTALENDKLILKCSIRDKKTKATNITDVAPEDFYAENSKCGHSFKEDTVVFHVGKGGGGTLMKHLGVGVNWVHPHPKPSTNEQLQNGPLRTLIFNVRDPVDRFVSAFNWRSAILCHPNDERHRGKKKLGGGKKIGATRRPDEFCKTGYEEEEILLRETYQSSPSVLAEALCRESPLRASAEQDFSKVHHNTTLTQWLDFLVDPRLVKNVGDDGIQEFIVLPVEKRPGANETLFEKHIENLRRHLLSNRYGADASNEMMRLAEEQKRKREETRSCQRKVMHKHEAHLHSSEKLVNSTKSKLTKLGECCLARYLTDDYRLIQSMLGGDEASNSELVIAGLDPLDATHPVVQKACSWGNEQQQELCQGDLMSILMRRVKYLDESKGSCSAIVSANS
eukprot:scaffold1915_cov143-Skeletonema_menzelii.AAC.11